MTKQIKTFPQLGIYLIGEADSAQAHRLHVQEMHIIQPLFNKSIRFKATTVFNWDNNAHCYVDINDNFLIFKLRSAPMFQQIGDYFLLHADKDTKISVAELNFLDCFIEGFQEKVVSNFETYYQHSIFFKNTINFITNYDSIEARRQGQFATSVTIEQIKKNIQQKPYLISLILQIGIIAVTDRGELVSLVLNLCKDKPLIAEQIQLILAMIDNPHYLHAVQNYAREFYVVNATSIKFLKYVRESQLDTGFEKLIASYQKIFIPKAQEEKIFALANDTRIDRDYRYVFIILYLRQHIFFKDKDNQTLAKIAEMLLRDYSDIEYNPNNVRFKKNDNQIKSILFLKDEKDQANPSIKLFGLGKGSTGSVRSAIRIAPIEHQFAITVLKTKKSQKESVLLKKYKNNRNRHLTRSQRRFEFDLLKMENETNILAKSKISHQSIKLIKNSAKGSDCQETKRLPDERQQDLLSGAIKYKSIFEVSATNAICFYDVADMPIEKILTFFGCHGADLPEILIRIFINAFTALQDFHAKGYLHHDVKLENMLIDRFGHIQLIDFDLSRHISYGPESGTGTPGYIAPELLVPGYEYRGSAFYKKIDVYSMGIACFTVLKRFFEKDGAFIEHYRRYIHPYICDKNPETRWSTQQTLEVLNKLHDKFASKQIKKTNELTKPTSELTPHYAIYHIMNEPTLNAPAKQQAINDFFASALAKLSGTKLLDRFFVSNEIKQKRRQLAQLQYRINKVNNCRNIDANASLPQCTL